LEIIDSKRETESSVAELPDLGLQSRARKQADFGFSTSS
jgi:hypothetical protein